MANFSLSFILGKPNKKGLCKVYLRYYSKSLDVLLSNVSVFTDPKHFAPNSARNPILKSNPNHAQMNAILNGFRVDVESRAIAAKSTINKEYLTGKISGDTQIVLFIDKFVSENMERLNNATTTSRGNDTAATTLTRGRLKIYSVIRTKLNKFAPAIEFKDINLEWLKSFESHIGQSISQNSLSSNMQTFIAILNKAKAKGLINSEQYENYKAPKYVQQIPEFLTEDELNNFYNVVKAAQDTEIKTCGYFFLLGCYTGYRLQDLLNFNHSERVKGDTLILRASKNNKIVSIPIFPKLAEVIEYVKDKRISITEQHFRLKVKLLASLAGIKRNIKIHTARHTFAMMFTNKGFSIEEVAEMLGDTIEVARIYSRITNTRLHSRIMEVMK